ncbi:MAG TPA: hypothetical protein DCF70_07575 [Treponema sp.]|nr:hypothetical protein [Treponema sp.]
MKKIILLICAAMMMAGCTTTKTEGSGIKGKSASVKTGKRVIVDYQGATLGKEVPDWVVQLVEGQYSQQVLSKVMPGLEGKKVFVTLGRGDNLDFVQNWSDLVDIETEVAGTLERVAGKACESAMNGQSKASGKQYEPSEITRTVNMYRASLVNVRLSGLEKIATYWLETQVIEDKKVTADYFEYYAVWAMDEKLFDMQLKQAMSKIDDTTTQSQELKSVVSSKLKQSVAISNNDSVKNEADDFIVNN